MPKKASQEAIRIRPTLMNNAVYVFVAAILSTLFIGLAFDPGFLIITIILIGGMAFAFSFMMASSYTVQGDYYIHSIPVKGEIKAPISQIEEIIRYAPFGKKEAIAFKFKQAYRKKELSDLPVLHGGASFIAGNMKKEDAEKLVKALKKVSPQIKVSYAPGYLWKALGKAHSEAPYF